MSGWGKLGKALAGVSDEDRAEIQIKTMNALANRDANVARAQLGMAKARDSARLGDAFKNIGITNPEDMAVISRSGANLNTLTGGMSKLQEQAFRQAAVEAATKGDWASGNAQMLGVANGPVEIPKVSGGMLLSNRLVPGGGDVSVTPVGQSTIDKNAVAGQASMIRAMRPAASRSGGGSGGATGKLSERQKGALADIKERKKIAMGVLESTAGAANPVSVAERAKAEKMLQELGAAESAIYDQAEGLGIRIAPPEKEINGIKVPEGFKPETFQHAVAINQDRKKTGLPPLTGAQMDQLRTTGEIREPVAPREAGNAPPVPGARKSPKDGLWYIPDPSRPGKYLRVDG
jgi:hypothetical protein